MTTTRSQLRMLLPLKVTPVKRDLEIDLLRRKRDLPTLATDTGMTQARHKHDTGMALATHTWLRHT